MEAEPYDFKVEYDAYGRIKKEVYPSSFYVSNEYDKNGFLIKVTDSKGQKIWEALAANVKGQLTRYKQGGYETLLINMTFGVYLIPLCLGTG